MSPMSNEVESRPVKSRKRAVKVEAAGAAGAEEAAQDSSAAPIETAAPASPPAPESAVESATVSEEITGGIEAVLLSVDRPVSAVRLAEALGLLDEAAADKAEESGEEDTLTNRKRKGAGSANSPLSIVRRAVALLNETYEKHGRAFRIESVAGGYRVMTLPRFAPVIEEFLGKRERTSLSRAAVETLAIIAYKQPITRAKLEAVRGVACGEVLRTLIERRLVAITGRAEELGRPMLYGTTKQFLEAFGLAGLKDLPSAQDFKARHAGGGED